MEAGGKTQENKQINKIVDEMDLFDDDLMTLVFRKNIPATELILGIIFGRKITVIDIQTQEEMRSPEIGGRDIRLDVHAIDADGTEIDIEVQGGSEGAHVRRTRFHSAVMDSRMLKEGDPFKLLKDSYVIFIYKYDKFGAGLPMYHIDRTVQEIGTAFGDGSHIIYVNGRYKGDDEIGKLIEDFHAKTSKNMNYKLLADGLHHFKETKEGRDIVCESVRKYAEEEARKSSEATRIDTLVSDIRKMMKNMKCSLEDAMNTLEITGNERTIIANMLQK
ncbi:MAG: PD-(D/E)XK nuclease family transposase [Oribacterium sp.]|nr:PD-(D/E)XK nuclease family transposase [Oribacterium sp.]